MIARPAVANAGPGLLALALVAVAYYLGARIGVGLTVMPAGPAILWPPNSILLAALLRYDGRGWRILVPLVLLAEVLADVPAFTVTEALLFGAVNIAEAGLAFALLRRFGFDPGFRRIEDLVRFTLAAPLAAAFVAAIGGATVYNLLRGAETTFVEFLLIWWSGDALGLMILTPVILRLWMPERFTADRPARPPFRQSDLALALAGLLVLGLSIGAGRAGNGLPFHPVLVLPFVLYFCARFGTRDAPLVVGAVAAALIMVTTRGWGPFGADDPGETVLRTQEFLFIMTVTGIGLAEIIDQYRHRSRELEDARRGLERRVAERTEELRRANEVLEARVAERTARLRELNVRLRRYALTDPLSGLPNRRAMGRALNVHSARARREDEPLVVLTIDMDDLKAINDRHGHEVGDRAIRAFASALQRAVRTGDVVARTGGDEFVVFGAARHAGDAAQLAERVLAAVRSAPLETPAGRLGLTASIGVTTLDVGDAGIRDTLRRADEALYAAKRAGRDRYELRHPAWPVGESAA